MGLYATVYVDTNIDLPYFPTNIDRDGVKWMSKQGLRPYRGPYKITENGRLHRKKQSNREKTHDEKKKEAERWGFDSWDAYVLAYKNMDNNKAMFPDSIEYDTESEKSPPPVAMPSEEVTDEEWWDDVNKHGTFEFHTTIKKNPVTYETVTRATGNEVTRPSEYELDIYLQYEARFTKGELEDIVLMSERLSDRSQEEVIEKLREWEQR